MSLSYSSAMQIDALMHREGLNGYTVSRSKQTRDVDPMLYQCWPTVYDVGPEFMNQPWVNVSCLLGAGALG